jgi:hypothetical protein
VLYRQLRDVIKWSKSVSKLVENGASVPSKINKLIVIVGASHSKRLEKQFNEAGKTTKLVDTPNFRLVSRDLTDLTAKLRVVLEDKAEDEAVILFNNIDNCFFLARSEDGHTCPPRKDLEDHYHIEGELVCPPPPPNTSKQLFINLLPLLKELGGYQKIVATPLPCYLFSPCCMDPDHVPNLENDDYVAKVLSDLDSTHRLWRGIAFRVKVANLKVCNVSRLLGEQTWWRSDPVHPTAEGYNRVAVYLTKGFNAMLSKEAPAETVANDGGTAGTSKHPLEAEVVSAPKRPAWLSRNENYVTRRESGPYRGSGGGGGGGWGWWHGHRGGWGNFY